jgi:hypothetical protein
MPRNRQEEGLATGIINGDGAGIGIDFPIANLSKTGARTSHARRGNDDMAARQVLSLVDSSAASQMHSLHE